MTFTDRLTPFSAAAAAITGITGTLALIKLRNAHKRAIEKQRAEDERLAEESLIQAQAAIEAERLAAELYANRTIWQRIKDGVVYSLEILHPRNLIKTISYLYNYLNSYFKPETPAVTPVTIAPTTYSSRLRKNLEVAKAWIRASKKFAISHRDIIASGGELSNLYWGLHPVQTSTVDATAENHVPTTLLEKVTSINPTVAVVAAPILYGFMRTVTPYIIEGFVEVFAAEANITRNRIG